MNCPFYGRHLFQPQPPVRGQLPFLLIDQQGNQCALVTDAYAPCLYAAPEAADWKACPRVGDVRISWTPST